MSAPAPTEPRHRAEALEAIKLELLGASERTISSQASLVARALAWADRDAGGKRTGWTRQDVQRYFAAEMDAGTPRGTLAAIRTALGTYLHAQGEEMPRRLFAGRRPGEESELPAALTPAQIAVMVAEARRRHPSIETAYMAAASVYGFRRDELLRLEIGPTMLEVETAKTHAPRVHSIPECVRPWLAGYGRLSPSEASARFHDLRKGAGIAKLHRAGWHSIRRALNTALSDAGVSDDTRAEFMAWKNRGYMPQRYYRPVSVDEPVFAVHPFTGLWK